MLYTLASRVIFINDIDHHINPLEVKYINSRLDTFHSKYGIKPLYFFPLFLSPEPPKAPFCCALALRSFSA